MNSSFKKKEESKI